MTMVPRVSVNISERSRMMPRLGTRNSMRTRPEPWLCILVISPLRGPSFSITTPVNCSGTSMVRCSTGSMRTPSTTRVTISGRPRHQFEAFAAHHLNQNRELQFPAAEDLEGVGRAGFFDAYGDVGEQLFF